MNIRRTLENLGLNKKEANIYLVSLELGESMISEIAKTAHLSRSSCYKAMEHLISLGLINVLIIGSRKFYTAGNPEKLLDIIRERETMIREVMPELKSRHRTRTKNPALHLYEGRDGLRAIFDDIIKRQYPLCAITSIDNMLDVMGDDFKDFVERRYKKNLRVKLLTSHTDKSTELKKRDNLEMRQTKFLPSSFTFTTANFIYGDRIAIISTTSKTPFGLIIENADMAQTYRNLFDTVWNQNTTL